MLYQLTNGRTVQMSVNQFLQLTEQDVQHLMAGQFGTEYNDPFHASALFDLKTGYASLEDTLNHADVVPLEELPANDQAELASVAGMQAIYDDGDYFSEED